MPLVSLFQRHRDRVTLLACVTMSLLLLNSSAELKFDLARAIGSVVFAPSDGVVKLNAHLSRLQGENEILRERVMVLSDEWNRVEEYRKEATRLRHLLEFRDAESYHFLPAELLSFPTNPRENNLIRVDRGRRDGVSSGMPVVSSSGLIGAVHTVHEQEAEVQLLSSKNFAVSCRDRRSRVLGVFKWDPRRGFHVDRVDLNEDVQVGDRFMTSGLGTRFPEGFLLGTVTDVQMPPGVLRKQILLEPSVRLQTLEDVFIVNLISKEAPGFPLDSSIATDEEGGP
ncbi:MAG: rod shape-determining protein MreC [bacterium]|nr:rod shape-determining protein MreC [bacterium]